MVVAETTESSASIQRHPKQQLLLGLPLGKGETSSGKPGQLCEGMLMESLSLSGAARAVCSGDEPLAVRDIS